MRGGDRVVAEDLLDRLQHRVLPVTAGAVQHRDDLLAGVAGHRVADEPAHVADELAIAVEDLDQEPVPARAGRIGVEDDARCRA